MSFQGAIARVALSINGECSDAAQHHELITYRKDLETSGVAYFLSALRCLTILHIDTGLMAVENPFLFSAWWKRNLEGFRAVIIQTQGS